MKTAISIPDGLFESAEGLAERLGVSRSELYARALREYIEEHKSEGITERLNEVYAGADAGRPDPVVDELQARSLPEDDGW